MTNRLPATSWPVTAGCALIALCTLTACDPSTIVRDRPDGPPQDCPELPEQPTTPEDTGTERPTTRTEPAPMRLLTVSRTGSPVLEMNSPIGDTVSCPEATVEMKISAGMVRSTEVCDPDGCLDLGPERFAYVDRTGASWSASALTLGEGDPAAGPVDPVEDDDELLWLCRDDEEKQACVCIPWFPPE